jgi:hypothetical protein
MDIIVIGKKSFKRSEPPQVVYCGQSRDEAMEAVYAAAKAGELVWFYFINPEPRTPITLPGPEQVAELEAIAARKRAKEQARLPTKGRKARRKPTSARQRPKRLLKSRRRSGKRKRGSLRRRIRSVRSRTGQKWLSRMTSPRARILPTWHQRLSL